MVMAVMVVMVVIMIMMVPMIVIMVMAVVVMVVAGLVVGIGIKLFGGHRLVRHLGKLRDKIDHFVLV